MPQQAIKKDNLFFLFSPLKKFFNDSRASGIMLISSTMVSLLFANMKVTSGAYISMYNQVLFSHLPYIHLPETMLLVINDALMAAFFLLVGMEIKIELTIGELSTVKKSLLPAIAAIGGMLFPALIFVVFNQQTAFQSGWAIPMATDIAFSLAILSLLGNRIPLPLKIFLTAFAIIDDLGAVSVIAIFYASTIKMIFLALAIVLVGILMLMNWLQVAKPQYYILIGIILWYVLFNSGIHATIAGVVLGFCMPLKSLTKLEHQLFRPVNFVIMPLFALANTAILLPSNSASIISSTLSIGIFLGLVVGKPIGIMLFSFIATKLNIAELPYQIKWSQMMGISILGGIGFTMSIFTSSLSFTVPAWLDMAKLSVIAASLLSGSAGYCYFYWLNPKAKP